MAYNPFNIFRRNQKAIFAVVTVFIMFTFVLSSGLGGGADFFDWLPRWLGSKSKKGDVVATLDGDKLYSSELEKIRHQRVIANRFMSRASDYAQQSLMSTAAAAEPTLSKDGKDLISSIRMYGSNPQLLQYILGGQIESILRSPTAKPEDKDAARAIHAAMSLAGHRGGASGEHYFINSPNATNNDLVNFLLWQKKADQLGIKFTSDDVLKLIGKEFYGFFRDDSEVAVKKELSKQMGGFSMNKAVEAIGEEFRVRAAQVAVLGSVGHGRRTDKTYGGFPAFKPPYDVYEYYREQTSPTIYGTIPVAAANYLHLVKDPDENDPKVKDELLKLFDQYKDTEPNPGREMPGFKKPREIKLEWLSVTGAEPYYVKFAEEQLQAGELQAKVGSMMTVPFFGVSPALIAPMAAPTALKEPLVLKAYEDLKRRHELEVRMGYGHSSAFLSDILSSSVVRPGNMAAAAGAVGGQLLAFGNPLAAMAKVVSGPMAYETRDRVNAGVPAILMALGSIPAVGEEKFGIWIGKPVPALLGPSMFANAIGGAVAYQMMTPKALPIEAVKPMLMKELIKKTAKEIAFGPTGDREPGSRFDAQPKKGDLQAFIDEVNKLSDNGKTKDKEKLAAVQKYISEFAAKRGLTLGKSTDLRTEWTLEEDPALAPLVTVQKDSLKSAGGFHDNQYIPFAQRFFWTTEMNRRSPTSGNYAPEYYPEQKPNTHESLFSQEPKPQYVVWRTEEVPAQAPKSYPAVKDAVKVAWKRAKAREMAKARAEALANEIRTTGPNSDALLKSFIEEEAQKLRNEFPADSKARDRIKPFLIDGVSPLTSTANPTAKSDLISFSPTASSGSLNPFRLVPSENVKYPSMPMLRTLMDERTKPVKTTFVLADEPKDTYYVTTLLERKMKTDGMFQSEVYAEDPLARMPGRGNPTRDVVLRNYNEDMGRKTIESVMGLLKKEFKYEETEEQKKKMEENEKRGGDQ